MDISAFYKALGARLAEARKDSSLTQAQLAARLKLARSAVANIEAGRQNLYLHSFLTFCKYLELDPAKVLNQLDDSNNKFVFPEGTDEHEQELILKTLSRE